MSAVRSLLRMQQLLSDDVALRLLRSDNAAVTVALLNEHLGGETHRRPAEELYELVGADLDLFRDHVDLPQTAQYYCTAWRESGFLIRRPAAESRGETLELSPGALAAIRVFEQIAEPRATVTESRLASIASQLNALAIETDPDTTRRLKLLEAQRSAIEERIQQVRRGESAVLETDRALERVREVITQAQDVPADFARVQSRFEDLNRSLRAAIIESEGSQRRVLDDVFRGVDLIDDSDEGRTFGAFAALVLDPMLGEAFEDDIDQVLSRPFAAHLNPEDRRLLRRFLSSLKERSYEIQDVITSFARGLRRYVQSQDYMRDRVLRTSIQEALATGTQAAKYAKPFQQTGLILDLSSVRMTSIGEIRLHDPAELDASAAVTVEEPEEIDLEALKAIARLTEIDFGELIDNVNAVLAEQDSVTVGEVLAHFPATQGVASVIGLVSLAAGQGVIDAENTETVTWTGTDYTGRHDVARASELQVHRFTGRVE